MILRRIIAHMRDQHWTAIAIDFVIVVVGVFVGIQASNYNAERAERRLEAEYTQRIVADLDLILNSRGSNANSSRKRPGRLQRR